MKQKFKGAGGSFETYVPNQRQKLFHSIQRWENWNKIIKGAIGGVGGGKSMGCLQELAEVCLRTPKGASLGMRASMPRAKGSLIDEFGDFIGSHATWIASEDSFYFANDHRLEMKPGDKWDRLGSTKYVAAFTQETQEFDYRIFSVISERLRHPAGMHGGVPWYRYLFDSRPIESRHWLNEKFIEVAWNADQGPSARIRAKKPFYAYVQFSSYDNKDNLRPGYIEELIEEHKDEPGWIKMMIHGEVGYSLEGAPVYGNVYVPEVHDATIEEDPRLPILRGWDFGYRSPAVLWCQWTRDGRLLVLREFCPKKIQRDRFVDELLAIQQNEFPDRHPSQYRDFGDVSGEQIDWTGITNIEYLENRLSTTFEGLKKDSIEDGIEVVRQLMRKVNRHNGRALTCFLVDERCQTLREALRGMYFYPEKGEHRPPQKGNGYDDVCDALRYVAQSIIGEGIDGPGWDSFAGGNFEAEAFAAY